MTEFDAKSVPLRQAFQINACFSILSAVTMLAAAKPLGAILGLPDTSFLVSTGITLLVFAAGLLWNAGRDGIHEPLAWLAVVMDVLWVLGSAGVILAGVLTPAGNWIAAVVADAVLIFAVFQFLGILKLKRAATQLPT